MFAYLKAAFWAGIQFEGLGKLPINALLVAAFVILGFGHPAFWLLGLGLEAAVLYFLATNERFQRVVDAGKAPPPLPESAGKAELATRLAPAGIRRHAELIGKVKRALAISETNQDSDRLIVDQNQETMDRLETLFLKLLVAQRNIEDASSLDEEKTLQRKVETLERELASPFTSKSLQESKSATLKVLRERLENLARKRETIAEIESDLMRIEAQVDLALENASIEGKPVILAGNFDLASHRLFETE